ncbi:mycofactocin precursor [Kribbella sp. VKM Ac-2527]|uniref:Mycofactocin n=1 Tax=Kribbella caucasensis TaxID=2512215 RepID=A0A4R6KQ74_9ACTN|nr:mycofactocin precursor MftA [Kribbella sp. VKM Ac-2527]TDO51779.1 mycofactocin precursor [Kribbella sp. VKM Ac-2527]
MPNNEPRTIAIDDPQAPVADVDVEPPVSVEALIEEVSIDGMCGVY